jgi:hypothetical protein
MTVRRQNLLIMILVLVIAVTAYVMTNIPVPAEQEKRQEKTLGECLADIRPSDMTEKAQRDLLDTAVKLSTRKGSWRVFKQFLQDSQPERRRSALLVLISCLTFHKGCLDLERQRTVTGFLKDSSLGMEETIISIVQSDPVIANREFAASLLSLCWPGSAAAREAAQDILARGESASRRMTLNLVECLSQKATQEELRILQGMSEYRDDRIVLAALRARASNGEKGALGQIIRFLDDRNPTLGHSALNALRQLTGLGLRVVRRPASSNGGADLDVVGLTRPLLQNKETLRDFEEAFLVLVDRQLRESVKEAWLEWWRENSEKLTWDEAERRFMLPEPKTVEDEAE